MNELDAARKDIDRIDKEMAGLFEERMQVAKRIAAYKKERGLAISDPGRENEIIAKSKTLVTDHEISDYYTLFQRNVISISCDYQSRLMEGTKVAYSGVEGAFAHIAAKNMFPDAGHVPCADFASAYKGVVDGVYDCAVLPLENNYAGEVGTVMDLIFSGNLFINRVMELTIRHHLIVNKGAKLEDIKKVVSHPQALSQCDDYIKKHGFETETFSNTAAAAKHIKEIGDLSVATIASEETARIFDLDILDSGINDAATNTTRFASFSRVQSLPTVSKLREDEHFILVFTVQNRAGALAQTLNIIGAHGFNMRNLRSRPMKDLQWNYYFYIEAEGNINSESGRLMMQELSALCARLKLVGTYFTGESY